MSSRKKKCSVRGCTLRASKFFNIPRCSDPRLPKWISACRNPKLENLSNNALSSRMVCGAHFEERYILSSKLSMSAIPTLHLPELETNEYVASSSSTAVPAEENPPAELLIEEPMPFTCTVGRAASLDAMSTTQQSNSWKARMNKKRRLLKKRNYESIAKLFRSSWKDSLDEMNRTAYNAF